MQDQEFINIEEIGRLYLLQIRLLKAEQTRINEFRKVNSEQEPESGMNKHVSRQE